MPPDISVHDNHLIAYTVFATERKIVLQTEFRDSQPHELTDIVFEEVLAYNFEGDLFSCIIFDVEEVDLARLLEEHAAKFEAGWRYGWPRGWEKEKEGIEAYVRRLEMRAFEVSSSYGMGGWVLAQNMSKIKKEANQETEPVRLAEEYETCHRRSILEDSSAKKYASAGQAESRDTQILCAPTPVPKADHQTGEAV